jgi:hypothetical protein
MARTPTEADFGLEVTEEEMAGAPPTVENDDDDIGQGDDDPAPLPVKAEPAKADAEPAKPADPAKPEEGKTVDLRALQEARAEAREAKQQAKLMEDRWNAFLAGQQQQDKPAAAEPPAVPKAGADPIGSIEWTQAQVVALLDKQKADAERTATQTREEQEFQSVAQTVIQDYEATKQADPTIDDAYNALRKSQGEEMLAMGYSIPEAKAELERLEREHIKFVASRGLPIGNYIKALASARGWQAGAPAVQQPAKVDLKAVAETQQRHQSLSDAPGGEAVPPLDAKALARMSDKDFKAWMSKKGNEDRFDDIMGR